MIKTTDQNRLIEVTQSKSSDDYDRWIAASYLGDFGKHTSQKTIEVLIALLKDGNQNVRDHAADSLGRIAGTPELKDTVIKQSLQPLVNLLKSGESLGAASAAKVLGQFGDSSAVDDLIRVMEINSKWWQIRKNAAIALGLIGDKRAVKPLVNALKDRFSPDIRISAAESLARLRDASAIDQLKILEADDNINVRIAVKTAINILKSY